MIRHRAGTKIASKITSGIAAIFAALLFLGGLSAARAAVFLVKSNLDDGSVGTLRWAILQNNTNPSPNNVIDVQPGSAQGEFVIILPLITGPVVIKANNQQVAVVLDGSNFINGTLVESCPASTGTPPFGPGEPGPILVPGTTKSFGPNVRSVYGPAFGVVDSGDVDISGFEIHDFCIGILSLRSHDNHFHHNHIYYTSGAAGILITGDAGNTAGSSTAGLSTGNVSEYNIIHDTGDGQECTRGTTNGIYQYNLQYERRNYISYEGITGGTRPGDNPYSQGIECAGTNDANLTMQGNNFSGYSDGFMHNSASNVLDVGNTIVGTTYGITDSSTGVVVKDNNITGNRMGVGPADGSIITITNNRIYDNGQTLVSLPTSAGGTTNPNSPAVLGIDIGTNGVTPNNSLGLQNFPVLSSSSVWNANNTFVLQGTLFQPSAQNATFTIEFFAGHDANPTGYGEGDVSLGTLAVTTDGTGNAPFTFSGSGAPFGSSAYFTATATNATGQTSEFSEAILLSRLAPMPISGCGTYSGSGNLTVQNQQHCVLAGAYISGNVSVTGGSLTATDGTIIGGNLQSDGASLDIRSTTVRGNLQVQNVSPGGGPAGLKVCGTTVQGNVKVQGGAAPIEIGSMVEGEVEILNGEAPIAVQCASNNVGGNLQVQSNTGSVAISLNEIGGNLQVSGTDTGWVQVVGNAVGGNSAADDNTGNLLIMANSAKGNLECQNNGVVAGSGNSAGGAKQGQCSLR